MSNESEHNSRHDEAGESMPNDKGHRKAPTIAPLTIFQLKPCSGHWPIRRDIEEYSGHSLVSRIINIPQHFPSVCA